MADNVQPVVVDSAYQAAHMWMKYHYGKPQECKNCGTTEKRMYHWANISRAYKRDRADWLRLCVPCHKSHDIAALGGKIKARPTKVHPTKQCAECGRTFSKSYQLSYKQWEAQIRCSRECAMKEIARKKTGQLQSAETRALKSQRLRERWATNQSYRERMSRPRTKQEG